MVAGARVVLGGDNVGYAGVLGDHPDLLINPKDTIGFANRLQYFLEHKDMRQAAYKWAQNSVKQYDVPKVAKQVLAAYKKA